MVIEASGCIINIYTDINCKYAKKKSKEKKFLKAYIFILQSKE